MIVIGKLIGAVVIAYLLGAIPFGLIIGKKLGKIDITKYGSGNIGATNVLRTLGVKPAALVALLDLAKAATAVLIARLIMGADVFTVYGFAIGWQLAQIMAALAAMMGHNWSVFLKFHGGKGVATFFGGLFVINFVIGLIAGGALVIIALVTRYMSLGSIIGASITIVLLIVFKILYMWSAIYVIYGLVAGGLIIFQHRQNINRLRTGTELRLGDKGQRLEL